MAVAIEVKSAFKMNAARSLYIVAARQGNLLSDREYSNYTHLICISSLFTYEIFF